MTAPSPTPPLPTPPLSRRARLARLIRRLGPVGPVALVSATLPALAGAVLVAFMNPVGAWLKAHPTGGLPLYMVGFAVLAGLPVLPTAAVSVLGGWAFGFELGLAAALAGYIGAAMVSYVFLHAISGDRVVELIDEKPKWKAIREDLIERNAGETILVVALLRVPPSMPFAVVNLLLVAARVRPGLFFVGTLLGILPRTAAWVYIASQLRVLDAGKLTEAGGQWMILGGIVATLLALAILGYLAKRALSHLTTPR